MTTYAIDGRAAASSAPTGHSGPATPSMVADQLDALLGEHLMPLRVRSGSADEPHLLAVDASGEPVVVEIVALLDEDAIVSALRHAGQAARMTTADLAAAYGGGPERYAAHLAAFRLTVPSTALLSTFVRGGARLLLVCSHIAPGMDEVLEFLLQPGWQVDVLRAEVVAQEDGSRVVELSPVGRSTPPERTVERPPWARDPEPDPAAFDPTPLYRDRAEAARRAGSSAVAPPTPTWSRPTAEPVPIDTTGWTMSGPPARVAVPSTVDSVPGWTSAPASAPRPSASSSPQSSARGSAAQSAVQGSQRQAAGDAAIRAGWAAPHPGWPWPPDDASELLEQTDPTWARASRPAPRVVPPSFAVPVASLDAARPDPALAAVADVLDGPVLLVWAPAWSATPFECLLHADGTLETAEGLQFGDVEAVSRAISGYTGPLDAWQAWHVDSAAGPTLAQLAAELFPDQF